MPPKGGKAGVLYTGPCLGCGTLNHRPGQKRCGGCAARKHRYGISIDERGKPCELCGEPARVVDHDHKTGKFRGWLCYPCNNGLANFGDSSERLAEVARYIKTAGRGCRTA